MSNPALAAAEELKLPGSQDAVLSGMRSLAGSSRTQVLLHTLNRQGFFDNQEGQDAFDLALATLLQHQQQQQKHQQEKPQQHQHRCQHPEMSGPVHRRTPPISGWASDRVAGGSGQSQRASDPITLLVDQSLPAGRLDSRPAATPGVVQVHPSDDPPATKDFLQLGLNPSASSANVRAADVDSGSRGAQRASSRDLHQSEAKPRLNLNGLRPEFFRETHGVAHTRLGDAGSYQNHQTDSLLRMQSLPTRKTCDMGGNPNPLDFLNADKTAPALLQTSPVQSAESSGENSNAEGARGLLAGTSRPRPRNHHAHLGVRRGGTPPSGRNSHHAGPNQRVYSPPLDLSPRGQQLEGGAGGDPLLGGGGGMPGGNLLSTSMRPRTVAERRRRNNISLRLDQLRAAVPLCNPRITTEALLCETLSYIDALKGKIKSLQAEKANLLEHVLTTS